MSTTLVLKSLELVDPDYKKYSKGARRPKSAKKVFNLIPENQKITKIINKKGQKKKVAALTEQKKLTIQEAKGSIKSKDAILKHNLRKLKQIQRASAIELDKETTKKIIERAVTRLPVKINTIRKGKKKVQKTVFTEEDFKKFEEEYMNS